LLKQAHTAKVVQNKRSCNC